MTEPVYYSCTKCRHSHIRVGGPPIACPSCIEQQALNALSRPLRLLALRQRVDAGKVRADHAEMIPAGVA